MINKTIAVVVVLLVLGATGWFFLNRNDEPEDLPAIHQNAAEMPVEEGFYPSGREFDESAEETRIILETPDNAELSNLLSEKVLRDGKVVDKSATAK